MARTARRRHLRHGSYERTDRSKRLRAFIAERAATLEDTGAEKTITATGATQAAATFTFNSAPVADDQILIGGTEQFVFVDALTEAKAEATLTVAEGQNAANNDTITIGSVTYTFKTNLSSGPTVANEIKIGADDEATALNIQKAINAEATAGTNYSIGTVVHPTVTAAATSIDVLLTAKTVGVAGNAIVATKSGTHLSYDTAGTLEDGVDAVPQEVLIEVAVADCIDNLVAAMTEDTGEGVKYSTGTVGSVLVDAEQDDPDLIVTAIALADAGNGITVEAEFTDVASVWDVEETEGGAKGTAISSTTHGLSAYSGPYLLTTTDTLPLGLSEEVLYFIKSTADASTLTLTTKRNSNVEVEYQDAGVGTHKLIKADTEGAIFEYMKLNAPEVVFAATDVDAL